MRAKQYGSAASLCNAPVVQKLASLGAGRRSQIGDAPSQERPPARPAPAILPDPALHAHARGEPSLAPAQALEAAAAAAYSASTSVIVVHPEAPVFSKVCGVSGSEAVDPSHHETA